MTDSSDTIKQMIKLIDQEAREKADSIVEDGRHRMQIEKNKIYKEEREKLIKLYKKKEDDEIVRAKTTKSRIINENRLKIQNNRNTYVEKLKAEICQKLTAKFTDKDTYTELLKGMIVQGLLRLMEKNIKIRVREEDADLARSILPEVTSTYVQFLKERTGKEKKCEITLVDSVPLKDSDTKLGGVMIYCNKSKIVIINTVEARINVCIAESIPLIRNNLFPSLAATTHVKKALPPVHRHGHEH